MERLRGVIQPYAWGSRTAIAELLGTTPNSVNVTLQRAKKAAARKGQEG